MRKKIFFSVMSHIVFLGGVGVYMEYNARKDSSTFSPTLSWNAKSPAEKRVFDAHLDLGEIKEPRRKETPMNNHGEGLSYSTIEDIPPHHLVDIFALDRLEADAENLLLNHSVFLHVESILEKLNPEEFETAKHRLSELINTRLGIGPAEQFVELFDNTIVYQQAKKAHLDSLGSPERLGKNLSSDELFTIEHQLQIDAFGYEDADRLFKAQRELRMFVAEYAQDDFRGELADADIDFLLEKSKAILGKQ